MKKNRKKSDTYRFKGNCFLHVDSIHAVDIADLELRIKKLEAKLADPNDPDDNKWTGRWLSGYRKEFDKKRVGGSLKARGEMQRGPVNLI